MSSISLNDLIINNLNKSSSQTDGSEQASFEENSNLVEYTDDRSLIGSTEQSSIYENSPSTRSVGLKISPVSIVSNSVDEKIESITKLEDVATSTKRFQTESGSFTSHTLSNYDKKIYSDANRIIEGRLGGDLRLPLAEEEDSNVSAYGNKNFPIQKRFTNNGDPIENLVSATLAFKEASYNQCDLLRAQTSAINRLATAIEDQNIMMTRFHTVVQKTSTKNLQDDTE